MIKINIFSDAIKAPNMVIDWAKQNCMHTNHTFPQGPASSKIFVAFPKKSTPKEIV